MLLVAVVSCLAAVAAPNVEIVDETMENEEVVFFEDENSEEIVFEEEEADFAEEELVVFDEE